MPTSHRKHMEADDGGPTARIRGGWLVLGMLALAILAAVLAITYQHRTTREATAYWGIRQAILIRDASEVTFCRLIPMNEAARDGGADHEEPHGDPTTYPRLPSEVELMGLSGQRWHGVECRPISALPGFSHLRHALLQDESYGGSQPADPSAGDASTDSAAHPEYALLFEEADERVVILLDNRRMWVRDAHQAEWRSLAPIAPFLTRFLEPLLGNERGETPGERPRESD